MLGIENYENKIRLIWMVGLAHGVEPSFCSLSLSLFLPVSRCLLLSLSLSLFSFLSWFFVVAPLVYFVSTANETLQIGVRSLARSARLAVKLAGFYFPSTVLCVSRSHGRPTVGLLCDWLETMVLWRGALTFAQLDGTVAQSAVAKAVCLCMCAVCERGYRCAWFVRVNRLGRPS